MKKVFCYLGVVAAVTAAFVYGELRYSKGYEAGIMEGRRIIHGSSRET